MTFHQSARAPLTLCNSHENQLPLTSARWYYTQIFIRLYFFLAMDSTLFLLLFCLLSPFGCGFPRRMFLLLLWTLSNNVTQRLAFIASCFSMKARFRRMITLPTSETFRKGSVQLLNDSITMYYRGFFFSQFPGTSLPIVQFSLR